MDVKRLVVCFFLLACALVHGQAKFSTNIDQSTISRNQLVQVEYKVENAKNIDDFDPPSFRNFSVVQGPIQSSGMYFVNGNLTQYKGLMFLLKPKTTGKLVIPGALATIDGKRMQSAAVAVEVTRSAGTVRSTRKPLRIHIPDETVEADREFVIYPNESVTDKIKKNLFVIVEVSKKTCYVNEPVIATFKLYSRLRSESRVVKRPSFNGFSVYDMIDPENSNPSIETVNGKRYNVHIIRKSQLFPLQTGAFTVEPVEIENTVHFIKASSEQDTYLEEYTDPYAETVEHTLTISSDPVDITVKPLPAGQPAAFDGAVGNFSVDATLKTPLIHSGESGTLLVEIKGKGNIPMINAPAVNWPAAVEAFDPSAKEEVRPQNAPLSGTKHFEYVFTAKDTGDITIPSVKFAFFDPVSQSYKTDSTRAINVRVVPGVKKASEDRKPLIRLNPSTRNIWSWVIAGAILTLMIILAAMVVHSRRHRPGVIPPPVKQPAATVAPTVKRDPLDKARRLLTDATPAMFIKEVEAVTWSEAGEKLNIPPVALNQPQVIMSLKQQGADESTIQSFRDLMHDCEYALYIPGQTAEDLQGILNKAEKFLEKLSAFGQ